MPPLNLEIRQWLGKYLASDISFEEFQHWFQPRAWNIESAGDPTATDLAQDIDLILAEASREDWPEDRLRAFLGRLLTNYVVRFTGGVTYSFGSQGSVDITPTLVVSATAASNRQRPTVDIRVVAAFS